jgi:pimeloyl-ACP methyl ester carboxylesterase
LRKQSQKAVTEGGEHAYSGYLNVPVWHMLSVQDRALPIELQRMLLQMAKDAGANVTARDIDSSHSPMLSRPQETAGFISEAVKAFMA